jgi:putative NIF3 family GTP cyclohydrolase 1 type 2
VKNKREKKIHRDKNGREFIKEAYFVGGKIKIDRIYIIEGLPAEEFYEKNATDLDFFMNGDHELMSCNRDSYN